MALRGCLQEELLGAIKHLVIELLHGRGRKKHEKMILRLALTGRGLWLQLAYCCCYLVSNIHDESENGLRPKIIGWR